MFTNWTAYPYSESKLASKEKSINRHILTHKSTHIYGIMMFCVKIISYGGNMRKILRFLKSYKLETILAPTFKMLEACFELIIPLVVADIIDNGIENADKAYIISRCSIMVALGVIGLVCSITAQFFAAKAATGFACELRSSLYSHIQGLSPSEKDVLGTSTLITRMTSDVNQIQNGINLVLRLFLRSPFIVLGAMVMAFTIDVRSALTFAVTIPALSVIVFGIMLISIPLYKKVQSRLDAVTLATRENLNGTRVIRAFNKEAHEIDTFGAANDAHTSVQMFAGRISALMNPLTYAVINLATVILIDKASVRVGNGVITQGELIALVNYMSQILVELIKLANLIISITKAVACGNRVGAIFDIPTGMSTEDPVGKAQDGHSFIEFCDVTLKYRNAAEPTLAGINVKIEKGQTVGVIGATGSGKSSFVNMIPRFYDATDGVLYFDGRDVKTLDVKQLRSRIGVVPQKAVLFKGTIRSNLLWGNGEATEEEMWRALELASAKEFVENKDDGLDAEVLQKGSNFSGGQRQRLTIARALIRRPEVLILDDSTSALDMATDAALRRAVAELDYDPTVFIVSQRASSVRNADKILVFEDGEMIGVGTHDELIRNCDVYLEIYRSQFGDEGLDIPAKTSAAKEG